VEVLCCVRMCENVSPRHSLVIKKVWSPNPQVHGKLIWSRVSPNRASGLGLIQTHYSQEMPKSPQGEGLETDKVSCVVFLCAPERRTP
jgi:hypothetical protein